VKTLARPRDKAEILRRLGTVRPENRRRWGRMSAHQMVCHASDALRMAMGQKEVSRATGLLQRTILKWTCLYVPLPWPAGIATRPEIDQQEGGTRPADFEGDMARLVALLEGVTSGTRFGGQVHPTFGTLSDGAWLRWGYLHLDHHLRQFGA